MRSWPMQELAAIISVKHGYPFESEYFSLSHGRYIVLTPGNFLEEGGFVLRPDKDRFYLGEFPPEYLLKKNDLILAMTEQTYGLLGSPALIPDDDKYLHNQRLGLVKILHPTKLDKHFLYYSFFMKYIRDVISSGASGTKIRHTSPDRIRKCKIPLPPLPIQRKIAAVLSAYDDLIENNTRRIAILEKMAEELYREWFVRLRFPGHEKTKIVKGVPEGWEHIELSEIAYINQSNVGKGFPNDWIDYLDISAVSTNAISKPDRMKFSEAPSRARRLVKHGDIIWSTVRPANRAFAVVLHPQNNLLVSTGFVVLTPRENIPFSFLHRVTTTNEFVDQMVSVAKGAAYPATSAEDFGKAKVWLPPPKLLEHFARVCDSIYLKAHYQRKQNELLSGARNRLLSRLMSGKIDLGHLDIHFPPSMREEDVAHA